MESQCAKNKLAQYNQVKTAIPTTNSQLIQDLYFLNQKSTLDINSYNSSNNLIVDKNTLNETSKINSVIQPNKTVLLANNIVQELTHSKSPISIQSNNTKLAQSNNIDSNFNLSLLPPPSELLLSGFNNIKIDKNKVLPSINTKNTFVNKTSNSSTSFLQNYNISNITTGLYNHSGSISSLYNGNDSISSASSISRNRFSHYQPIFAIEGNRNKSFCF